MRIIATADLHYEWDEAARQQVRRLAEEVSALGGDVLAIAGDTFAFDVSILEECLALFGRFEGARLLVAGNHDIWTRNGENSLTILNEIIPEVCRRFGFHPLDQGPFRLGEIGFVGTIGWYDYSFRDPDLEVPYRFYRCKTGPGYALRDERWRHLVSPPHPEPTPEQRRINTQWMDVRYVKLGMSDEDFTGYLAARLLRHIASIRREVEAMVCVMHHLPFREAVVQKQSPGWRFGNAFMGAAVFGEILQAEPKVRMAIYGHSHSEGIITHGHITGVNCGSTYRRKQYVVVDTFDWSVEYRRIS